MLANARHPVIFPLSPSEAECTAADAYAWSRVRARAANRHLLGHTLPRAFVWLL
jgi:hypothetical protein